MPLRCGLLVVGSYSAAVRQAVLDFPERLAIAVDHERHVLLLVERELFLIWRASQYRDSRRKAQDKPSSQGTIAIASSSSSSPSSALPERGRLAFSIAGRNSLYCATEIFLRVKEPPTIWPTFSKAEG